MTEKPVYTQKAPEKSGLRGRTALFFAVIVVFIALLVVVNMLPYSGILTLVLFAVVAWFMHKLLNGTVFDITYALYEDRLVFIRRYGRLEWECEVFPFEEAKFHAGKIEHRGKTYEFYPDDKLKEFLEI